MRYLSLFKAKREIRLIVRTMIGQEKGVKPVLLKFGLALALSFAGFLYSRFRIRRIKPSKSRKRGSFGWFCLTNISSFFPPSVFLNDEYKCLFRLLSFPGNESEVNSGGGIGAALSTCNTISAGNFLCSVSCFWVLCHRKK